MYRIWFKNYTKKKENEILVYLIMMMYLLSIIFGKMLNGTVRVSVSFLVLASLTLTKLYPLLVSL